MRREFLPLAKTYRGEFATSFLVSEKLDGMRVFWDGGVTRGRPTTEVPWANLDRGFRPMSTGLWSRYGNVVCAPDYWLDELPPVTLDGELFLGHGQFQRLRSIVSKHTPLESEWRDVELKVLDLVPFGAFLQDGRVNSPQFKKEFKGMSREWASFGTHGVFDGVTVKTCENHWPFYKRLQLLEQLRIVVHPQYTLTANWREELDAFMDTVTAQGGEGLILKREASLWVPKRTNDTLKLKPAHDSEGVITGFVWGEGKYAGMMGACIVKWRNIEFKLSGFTDEERRVEIPAGRPGEVFKDGCVHFKVGNIVTFKYRELSDAGVPKEARYYR